MTDQENYEKTCQQFLSQIETLSRYAKYKNYENVEKDDPFGEVVVAQLKKAIMNNLKKIDGEKQIWQFAKKCSVELQRKDRTHLFNLMQRINAIKEKKDKRSQSEKADILIRRICQWGLVHQFAKFFDFQMLVTMYYEKDAFWYNQQYRDKMHILLQNLTNITFQVSDQLDQNITVKKIKDFHIDNSIDLSNHTLKQEIIQDNHIDIKNDDELANILNQISGVGQHHIKQTVDTETSESQQLKSHNKMKKQLNDYGIVGKINVQLQLDETVIKQPNTNLNNTSISQHNEISEQQSVREVNFDEDEDFSQKDIDGSQNNNESKQIMDQNKQQTKHTTESDTLQNYAQEVTDTNISLVSSVVESDIASNANAKSKKHNTDIRQELYDQNSAKRRDNFEASSEDETTTIISNKSPSFNLNLINNKSYTDDDENYKISKQDQQHQQIVQHTSKLKKQQLSMVNFKSKKNNQNQIENQAFAQQNFDGFLFVESIQPFQQDFIKDNKNIQNEMIISLNYEDQQKKGQIQPGSQLPFAFEQKINILQKFLKELPEEEPEESYIETGDSAIGFPFENHFEVRQLVLTDENNIFLSFRKYEPSENIELAIQKQQNTCQGCGQLIDEDPFLWFCQYSGFFYCNKCEQRYIVLPDTLLQQKDIESPCYFQLAVDINQIYYTPIILTDYLPHTTLLDKRFIKTNQIRKQLLMAYYYVSKCSKTRTQYSYCIIRHFNQLKDFYNKELTGEQENFDAVNIIDQKHEHLICHEAAVLFKCKYTNNIIVKSTGYWSLKDLELIRDNGIDQILLQSLSKLKQHSINCQQCQKNFNKLCICGIQVNICESKLLVCNNCGAVMHQQCYLARKKCYVCNQKQK